MEIIKLVACIAIAFGNGVAQAKELAPSFRLKDAAAEQAQSPPASRSTKTPSSPPSVDHEVHCDVEAKCLMKLGGIASRSGKNLDLKLDNGSTKSIPSTDDCEIAGEACTLTSLVSYRPSQHLFVLSAKYYESFGSIIVSRRSGEIFRIEDATPQFSPDGRRFVD